MAGGTERRETGGLRSFGVDHRARQTGAATGQRSAWAGGQKAEPMAVALENSAGGGEGWEKRARDGRRREDGGGRRRWRK